MRTEEVLSAIETGLWRWDSATGGVYLDAEAARLLGLPREPVTTTTAEIRAHLHPVDWNEISGIIALAVSERTLAELRIRVVDEHGRVLRTVRSRSKPYRRGEAFPAGGPVPAVGTPTVLDGYVPGPPDGDDATEGRQAAAPVCTSVDPSSRAGELCCLIGTLQEVVEPRPGAAVDGSPVTGDWRRSREAFLLDAGRALAEARSTAEVLRVAASLSMPGFSPDALAVFGATGRGLRILGIQGNTVADLDGFPDLTLDSPYPAADVVRTGRAVYLPSAEAYASQYPVFWPYVEPFQRDSWAFLPLIVAGRTIGTWMAAFKNRVAFTPDERSVLTTVARMLAQALARAEATESERQLSLGLQRSMMPTITPDIPGMSVAARYIPTGGGLQVGGDWYDMIPLPGGRFAMVIGDVQGHDVRAAGLMGQLRIALRAYAAEGHRPDAVLSRASRFLAGLQEHPTAHGGDAFTGLGNGPGDGAAVVESLDAGSGRARRGAPERVEGRFATCLYMEVDPATGTLDIARAGHPDPVVRMADGTAIIRQTAGGLPLGIAADSDYPITRLVLGHGELMMLCTDGLIETGGHDMYTGWGRLRPIIEEPRDDDSLEKLADALIESVYGPASHHTMGPLPQRSEDDIAVLLLGRDVEPEQRGRVAPRRTMFSIAQAEPARISDARRQLRELLHDWHDPDQVDSAVLMVSEMITNVLLHTDGDAVICAQTTGETGGRTLRVEVTDTSDELPHRRRPGELASSGRGLILMEVLADEWGVDPRGDGKTIWFELGEH